MHTLVTRKPRTPEKSRVRGSSVFITPHQLRHTYITELILSGANIKTVQYLAGHKNVKLTLDIYTHLIENQPIDTAPTVIKAFEAKPQVNEFDKLPQSVDKSGVFN